MCVRGVMNFVHSFAVLCNTTKWNDNVKFCVVWKTWTTTADVLNFYFTFFCCVPDSARSQFWHWVRNKVNDSTVCIGKMQNDFLIILGVAVIDGSFKTPQWQSKSGYLKHYFKEHRESNVSRTRTRHIDLCQSSNPDRLIRSVTGLTLG